MIRMICVEGMVGAVSMLHLAALVVMAMVVMAMLAMSMFVAVVSFAVVHILGSIGIHGCRLSWATSGHRCAPFLVNRR